MIHSAGLVGTKSVKDMLYKLSLDRLSICFNEPNKESVKKTCGLLVSDHMNKCIPGMVATSNPRYEVSCNFLSQATHKVSKALFASRLVREVLANRRSASISIRVNSPPLV